MAYHWPEVVDKICLALMWLIGIGGSIYIVAELGGYILLWLFGLI